jgi:hypothetical protein
MSMRRMNLLFNSQHRVKNSMLYSNERICDQTKDEKRIVVPALRRTSSGVSMEYKCIIITKSRRKLFVRTIIVMAGR